MGVTDVVEPERSRQYWLMAAVHGVCVCLFYRDFQNLFDSEASFSSLFLCSVTTALGFFVNIERPLRTAVQVGLGVVCTHVCVHSKLSLPCAHTGLGKEGIMKKMSNCALQRFLHMRVLGCFCILCFLSTCH